MSDDWMPIESAPKSIEGAIYAAPRLLLAVPPYGVFTGCWCPNPEFPWGGSWSVPGLLNKVAQPTHWLPLPPPPAQPATAEGVGS